MANAVGLFFFRFVARCVVIVLFFWWLCTVAIVKSLITGPNQDAENKE